MLNGSVQSFQLSDESSESAVVTVSSVQTDVNALTAALTAAAIPFQATGGSGTEADPWTLSYTGSDEPKLLNVTAFTDPGGTTAVPEFGVIYADALAASERQSVYLSDDNGVESIDLTFDGQTVTWSKNGGFVIADF